MFHIGLSTIKSQNLIPLWTTKKIKNKDFFVRELNELGDECLYGITSDILIFPKDEKELIKKICSIKESDLPTYLAKTKGEYAFVVASGSKIIFGVDKLGALKLYYFYNGKDLVVSTDFWDIVKIIRPDEEDLDWNAIKEFIFMNRPLFHKTILKNVKVVPPGTFIVLDRDTNSIEEFNYFDISFNPKDISAEVAMDKLHASILQTIKETVSKYKGKTFGVGISGGLDSRIIPYYLMLSGVKKQQIKAFIVGSPKPHKIAFSRDFKSAMDISKFYGVELNLIDWLSEDIEKKILIDVCRNPLCNSNIPTTTLFEDFDVLITGGYGTIIGGHVLNEKIFKLNDEELAEFIFKKFSLLRKVEKSSVKQLYTMVFRFLRKEKRHMFFDNIGNFLTRKDTQMIIQRILKFIKKEKKMGKTNFDILMKFHLNYSQKLGSFESLQGRKQSISIYYPLVFDEVLSWPYHFLFERNILKMLILRKFSKLSLIPPQNYSLPLGLEKRIRSKILRKLISFKYFISFLLRGRGLDYIKFLRNPKTRRIFFKILKRKNPWFKKHVTERAIKDIYRFLHPRAFENLVKVKIILDIIYSQHTKKEVEVCDGIRK